MTLSFLAAIERLPLGTSVTIEFLGPLTVAAMHSHSRRALAWLALALAGVVLLTEPWQGTPSLPGIPGPAISLPVVALASAVVGVPQAWGQLTLDVLLVGLAAAVLLPLIPRSLQLYALRRLTKAAFGTLMALKPAIVLVIGLAVLHQAPGVAQLLGIAFVVLAGVAAERSGRRDEGSPARSDRPAAATAGRARGATGGRRRRDR